MPIGDPQDRFFYPILTLLIDSYILVWSHKKKGGQEWKYQQNKEIKKPAVSLFNITEDTIDKYKSEVDNKNSKTTTT